MRHASFLVLLAFFVMLGCGETPQNGSADLSEVGDTVGKVDAGDSSSSNDDADTDLADTYAAQDTEMLDDTQTNEDTVFVGDTATLGDTGTLDDTVDVEDVNDTTDTDVATYTVGGTVSGLTGTVTLRNNGADPLRVDSVGAFTFATPLPDGALYNVAVSAHPVGQACSVADGAGTIASADVTDIAVDCVTRTYVVGGTVSGLIGTVVLENNGADDLTLSADGSFAFATPIAFGAQYDVTVGTQPSTQTCSVSYGAGTMGASSVTDVEVTCETDPLTCPGDDPYEVNDTQATATAVAANSATSGILCTGDADWYVVSVGDGCVVDLSLRFVHADGDLDLALVDATGQVLGLGNSTSNDESLHFISDIPQDLSVQVILGGGTENTYTLEVATSCPTLPLRCPQNDLFEPNNGPANATALNPDYTRLPGIVCAGDLDLFDGVLHPGCWFMALAEFDNVSGDLDLQVRLASNLSTVAYGWTSTDNEEVSYIASADATSSTSIIAGVLGLTSGTWNDYRLTTRFVCPESAASCPADDIFDAFGGNDVWNNAVHLNEANPYDVYYGTPTSAATLLDAASCANDDWYYAWVDNGCTLRADVVLVNASGDLDVSMYRFNNWTTPQSTSSTTSDFESASVVGPSDYYFVRVYGKTGTETNTYRLRTVVSCP